MIDGGGGGGLEQGEQSPREEEGGEEVGLPLQLEAVGGEGVGCRHDLGLRGRWG